ncbi:MAG: SpoIIE family protein phosphatase [Chlorobi bacterium]|nr:SpoIIE family protein phosphatase [Chlorobiota bacterium]MCI0715887.1 SpoIIE family protein phosphatase [Chlorobiota bacterium]
MTDISTPKLIVSYFVRFLGIFLVIFTLMAAYLGFSSVININREGTTGMRITSAEDPIYLIISNITEDYPAYNSGLMNGDTIIKINGIPVSDKEAIKREIAKKDIGSRAVYTIKRGDFIKDYPMQYVSLAQLEKLIVFLFRTIPVTLLFAYLIVGLWGIFKSPYANETILIAMFCFCFGSFMYATVQTGTDPENFVRKYLYFDSLREFVSYIMWLGSSFWMLLFAVFPKKIRFYENHKIISLLFIFLLPIIVIMMSLMSVDNNTLNILVITLMFINMSVGIILLTRNSRIATTALEKRQIRLMLFGIKYGAISIGIGWLIVLFTQFIFSEQISDNVVIISFIIFLICEIGGLIIPFTFLNSFFQNKLLETESALKRRVRYVGVTIGLLGVYLFAIFLLGRLSISIFEIKDPTVIIVMVLLLSLTFTPINKRLLKWIDETFYPEKTKYANSFKEFMHRISGQIESGELLSELSRWVQKTTGIVPVIPFALGNELALQIPFRHDESDSVIHRIRSGSKFFWDEISERSRITVDENEIEWVRENEISVTIPMISQGELVGVLNLGKKLNDEDFTAEDLDILSQASNQAALALQNLKLQSAYIEKKRMDKELEMARNIQRRLMPQEIPVVRGLEIYGESRPCKEVAGDYYDIINTEDGYTIMVIADVSGKGAGAAMIMANLQASIRVGIEISEDFTDFIYRINNHIYRSTSPSEFITFFMGIWEPKSKTLHYINAGHNPAILINRENNIKALSATGLILGILPDQKYERASVMIEDGSLLAIFTDGLEEALNRRNELFSQERIIQCLMSSKHLGPREIIKSVNTRVIEFCEGNPLHDDLTMIVAKSV